MFSSNSNARISRQRHTINLHLPPVLLLIAAAFSVAGASTVVAESRLDFLSGIRKFDVHTHDRTDEPFHRQLLEEGRWKDITI